MLSGIVARLAGCRELDHDAVLKTVLDDGLDGDGFIFAVLERHPGLSLDEAWEVWAARELLKTERWLESSEDGAA